jgi:hypothetical protein
MRTLIASLLVCSLGAFAAEPVDLVPLPWTSDGAKVVVTGQNLAFTSDPGPLASSFVTVPQPLTGTVVLRATCRSLPGIDNPNFTILLGKGATLAGATIGLGVQNADLKSSTGGVHNLKSAKTENGSVPWVGTDAFKVVLTLDTATRNLTLQVNDWSTQTDLSEAPAPVEQVGLLTWKQGIQITSLQVDSK